MQQPTRRIGRKQFKWLVGLLATAILIGIIFLNQRRKITQHTPPGMVLWAEATAEEKPISAELLSRGQRIYASQCATCHGKTGAGDGTASLYLATPPRDFTQLVFKFRTTENFPSDQDLFRSISAGFPAYGMPPFRFLPEEERWSLVHHIKKIGRDAWIASFKEQEGENFDPKEAEEIVTDRMKPGKTMEISDEPLRKDGHLDRGKGLYEKNCVSCHGAGGHGDGPSAPTLKDHRERPIKPRDFTASPVFRKSGWRARDLVRMTKTGIGGTPMPTFDFTNEERWEVARYVDHLTEQAHKEKTGGQP